MEPIERRFVALNSPTADRSDVGYHPCQGIYHLRAGSKPKTAAIATHYNADFSEHYLGEYFAERGYGFLGWNTRFRGAEAYFMLEHALIDIGVGVRWLREVAGVENVVIIGNSGGGSLMGAYQSQAAKPNLLAQPGMQLPEAANELLEADFYIALNAHMGRPEVLTSWMDPSVTDENDPTSVDPPLDMYDPANAPPYKPEFVERYRKAQQERNHRITAWAWSELARLEERGLSDRLFTMQRAWADLRMLDGALDPSDRPVGVCYAGDPKSANYGPMGIGYANTCQTWLSMWSLEHSWLSMWSLEHSQSGAPLTSSGSHCPPWSCRAWRIPACSRATRGRSTRTSPPRTSASSSSWATTSSSASPPFDPRSRICSSAGSKTEAHDLRGARTRGRRRAPSVLR